MRQTVYRTTLALALSIGAADMAVEARHDHHLVPFVACVALAYTGLVALGYAVAANVHAGRADACRRSHRKPSGRPRGDRQPGPATMRERAR